MRNFVISLCTMCPHLSNLLLRKVHLKTQAHNSNSHIGIGRFIAHFLYCASRILHFFFFYKLKVCVLSKSMGSIFPTAFAHFVSLCQILVILGVVQIFS